MEHPNLNLALPVRDVYTVTRLNREVKRLLETGFPLLWIEGEISNLARPTSGHLYFSLKDGDAQIRCALFRGFARLMRCVPKDGMLVMVRARVSLYEGRGEFQLLVEHIEESGEGALRRAFEVLKTRLTEEGLFDNARKRALPRLPRRVGIVTSPTGAAVRDVVTTFRRRFSAIGILIYPVPVQGISAAEKIAAMIELASARRECDALILARGGGSLEDLWPFNEEVVARALARCALPVVTGIGHETDVTIADLVADVRAPTPTAAAELLSQDCDVWSQRFADYALRCQRLVTRRLQESTQHVDWLSTRLIHPQARLQTLRARFNQLGARIAVTQTRTIAATRARLIACNQRLAAQTPAARIAALTQRTKALSARQARAIHTFIAQRRQRFAHRLSSLETLSPLATLARGYAIVKNESGQIVRHADSVAKGERVMVKLAHGKLVVRVDDKENN